MNKEKLKQYARVLRNNTTDAEQKLWRSIRNRQVAGHKFRRQQRIGGYIVDFVCFEKSLIIELDGSQHLIQQQSYDQARTDWLISEGFTVLRFWNNQVMQEMGAVLEVVFAALINHHGVTPPPQPSPLKGEGEKTKHPSIGRKTKPSSRGRKDRTSSMGREDKTSSRGRKDKASLNGEKRQNLHQGLGRKDERLP